MPSLIQRITQFSRSKQGRGLIRQVQNRLAGGRHRTARAAAGIGAADMAELTPLDEKLGEVLGLAQAAQNATEHVSKMEGADAHSDQLERMNDEAEETERRTDALVDTLEGRKTAIRELAQETKSEAEEMMKTYLEDEEEALDGFEFLTMAEAGELGHWEIVQTMAKTVGDQERDRPRRLGGRRAAPSLRLGAREQPQAGRGGSRRLNRAVGTMSAPMLRSIIRSAARPSSPSSGITASSRTVMA